MCRWWCSHLSQDCEEFEARSYSDFSLSLTILSPVNIFPLPSWILWQSPSASPDLKYSAYKAHKAYIHGGPRVKGESLGLCLASSKFQNFQTSIVFNRLRYTLFCPSFTLPRTSPGRARPTSSTPLPCTFPLRNCSWNSQTSWFRPA